MFNALGVLLDQLDPAEGSLEFSSSDPPSLLREDGGSARLLEFGKDGYVFILDRLDGGELVFMRGRPNAPTRIARFSVADVSSVKQLFVAITWSSEQDGLYVGDGRNSELATVTATEVKTIQFRTAPDGSIIQIGDEGVHVPYFRLSAGGEVVESTAKELFDWKLERINVVLNHCDKIDLLFETTLVQQVAASLVAALEQYARDRFVEMADEGWKCDLEALMEEFISPSVRDSVREEIGMLATEKSKSELAVFIQDQRRINFQAWDRFKKAYKLGYGISIGELGLDSDVFDALRDIRTLRHKVIHVKGDHTVVNLEDLPAADPVFATKTFGEKGLLAVRALGEALHETTLEHRR